jgi:hypothetical protein
MSRDRKSAGTPAKRAFQPKSRLPLRRRNRREDLETIDDITIAFEEEGEVVVEELDKVIIQKGVWAVILFRFQERNRKTGEFNAPKAALRRYQKFKGEYKKRDSVNISKDSAQILLKVLGEWLETGLLGDTDGD